MGTSRAEEPDVMSWSPDISLGKGESWTLNLHRSFKRPETLSHCCSEESVPLQILEDLFWIGKLHFSSLFCLIWGKFELGWFILHWVQTNLLIFGFLELGCGWIFQLQRHHEEPKCKLNQFYASESTERPPHNCWDHSRAGADCSSWYLFK